MPVSTRIRSACWTRSTAPDWEAAYLRWELALLEETGFGLSLGDLCRFGIA